MSLLEYGWNGLSYHDWQLPHWTEDRGLPSDYESLCFSPRNQRFVMIISNHISRYRWYQKRESACPPSEVRQGHWDIDAPILRHQVITQCKRKAWQIEYRCERLHQIFWVALWKLIAHGRPAFQIVGIVFLAIRYVAEQLFSVICGMEFSGFPIILNQKNAYIHRKSWNGLPWTAGKAQSRMIMKWNSSRVRLCENHFSKLNDLSFLDRVHLYLYFTATSVFLVPIPDCHFSMWHRTSH
jgi:hypothetical protein